MVYEIHETEVMIYIPRLIDQNPGATIEIDHNLVFVNNVPKIKIL